MKQDNRRKYSQRQKSKQEAPSRVYPEGYFTALIRLYDWPPFFESRYQRTREVEQSEQARLVREGQLALGRSGTIVGISPSSDARLKFSSAPGWIR